MGNMSARLTRKKLKDCRFRETEKAIFEAFFGGADQKIGNVNELIQKAGIDKATFYRHHETMNKIIEDYEQYILEEFNVLIDEIRDRNGVGLRKMYGEMLRFILQNQRVFEALMKKKELKIMREMVLILRPEIVIFVKIPDSSERVLKVYVGEVVGLVEDWGLDGFEGKKIVGLLNNIMYLTETIGGRLLPLVN